MTDTTEARELTDDEYAEAKEMARTCLGFTLDDGAEEIRLIGEYFIRRDQAKDAEIAALRAELEKAKKDAAYELNLLQEAAQWFENTNDAANRDFNAWTVDVAELEAYLEQARADLKRVESELMTEKSFGVQAWNKAQFETDRAKKAMAERDGYIEAMNNATELWHKEKSDRVKAEAERDDQPAWKEIVESRRRVEEVLEKHAFLAKENLMLNEMREKAEAEIKKFRDFNNYEPTADALAKSEAERDHLEVMEVKYHDTIHKLEDRAALAEPEGEACDVCAMPEKDRVRPCGNCGDPGHAAWECVVESSAPASGKPCECGSPSEPFIIHRTDGPCHYPVESGEEAGARERRWLALYREACGKPGVLPNHDSPMWAFAALVERDAAIKARGIK